jgi:hypothetical protein
VNSSAVPFNPQDVFNAVEEVLQESGLVRDERQVVEESWRSTSSLRDAYRLILEDA